MDALELEVKITAVMKYVTENYPNYKDYINFPTLPDMEVKNLEEGALFIYYPEVRTIDSINHPSGKYPYPRLYILYDKKYYCIADKNREIKNCYLYELDTLDVVFNTTFYKDSIIKPLTISNFSIVI